MLWSFGLFSSLPFALLRDLLRTKTAWLWGPQQVDAFTCLKKELASDSVFWIYHAEYDTIVSADVSSYGLGAFLLQKQPTGELKPVAYASRSTTDTECRYSQIEKEALALTWALKHWRDCLIRRPKVKVETDHKPLVPLFTTKLVDELPLGIQSFRVRVQHYSDICPRETTLRCRCTLSRPWEVFSRERKWPRNWTRLRC